MSRTALPAQEPAARAIPLSFVQAGRCNADRLARKRDLDEFPACCWNDESHSTDGVDAARL